MSLPASKNMADLAAHLAAGGTVLGWCRETNTPQRTAYSWKSKPQFQELLAQATADQSAIRLAAWRAKENLLAERSPEAVKGLWAIAEDPTQSGGVRLQAYRVILEQDHRLQDLEGRIAALLRERERERERERRSADAVPGRTDSAA